MWKEVPEVCWFNSPRLKSSQSACLFQGCRTWHVLKVAPLDHRSIDDLFADPGLPPIGRSMPRPTKKCSCIPWPVHPSSDFQNPMSWWRWSSCRSPHRGCTPWPSNPSLWCTLWSVSLPGKYERPLLINNQTTVQRSLSCLTWTVALGTLRSSQMGPSKSGQWGKFREFRKFQMWLNWVKYRELYGNFFLRKIEKSIWVHQSTGNIVFRAIGVLRIEIWALFFSSKMWLKKLKKDFKKF